MKALVGAFNQDNLLRDCENRLWNRWIVLQHYSLPRSNIPAWTGWGEQRISRAPLNIDIYKIPSSAPPLSGFRALAGPNTAQHQSCLGTWETQGPSAKRGMSMSMLYVALEAAVISSHFIFWSSKVKASFSCVQMYIVHTQIHFFAAFYIFEKIFRILNCHFKM